MSEPIREHLVLALDVGGLDDAIALARRLAPWFATAKVGYELYAEAGPHAFARLHDAGFAVFADLKLHDIPTTVERAARALGRHGVEFCNFHAAGGRAMLEAGVNGLREGAQVGGHAAPLALAVTVLTSDADASQVGPRLVVAAAAGCDGVVCAGADIATARNHRLRTMVPGVRMPDGDAQDQARVVSPRDAMSAGADWLVIGRAVTAAPEPEVAAAAVAQLAAESLR